MLSLSLSLPLEKISKFQLHARDYTLVMHVRYIRGARAPRDPEYHRFESAPNKLCTSPSDNNIDIVLEGARLNPRVPRNFQLRLLISVRQKSMPLAHFSKISEHYYIRFSTILSAESSGFNGGGGAFRARGSGETGCI